MFIDYGLDKNGELVYIGQVSRGKTGLACPYCGGLLLAKKGSIKTAHFAHAGETCAAANRDADAMSLPAYDKFDLHLPGKVLKALQAFGADYYSGKYDLLLYYGLITENTFGRGDHYTLTHKGKVPLGQLSLDLFNRFQAEQFATRHTELEARAERLYPLPQLLAEIEQVKAEIRPLSEALGAVSDNLGWTAPFVYAPTGEASPRRDEFIAQRRKLLLKLSNLKDRLPPESDQRLGFQVALTDLRLYRAQWQRVRSSALYFLAINGGQYYKIGVTTRAIEERLAEIAVDLRPLLGAEPTIEVLGTWPQRGNVEPYFKFRYQEHQTKLGELTEYFQFADIVPVLRDLRRMKPDPPTDLEIAILAGEQSAIEARMKRDAIEEERRAAEEKRRTAIRTGMRRVADQGQSIGRPRGSVVDDQALLAKYPQVVEVLRHGGFSLRETATMCQVAVNTVRKVQGAMERAVPKRQESEDISPLLG